MPDALDKLVRQSGRLYTLPSVAMEVLRLADADTVDVPLLKQAIERDPALAGKLLRVVNSSLFGLSGKVADLNQALALLGVEPLKVLVLGFSLPEEMFAKLAGEPLKRYWTASLTRAVAARSMAARFPAVSGDEALLAGLLRGIGQLAMLQHLGEPYLRFLELALEKPGQVLELEHQSLGFNHTQLSAALLSDWQLPDRLIAAVNYDHNEPSRRDEPLQQVLDLADLLLQLVLDRRLDSLPELLELGEQACGLDKPSLNQMLDSLQSTVDQFAEAMSVELTDGLDYQQVLVDAHAKLSLATENAIGSFLGDRTDDQIAEDLLAESHEVRLAMRSFLRGDSPGPAVQVRTEGAHTPQATIDEALPIAELSDAATKRLTTAVDKSASRCRIERTDLSLVVLRLTTTGNMEPIKIERFLKSALGAAQDRSQVEQATRLTMDDNHLAVLMPGTDRPDAIAFAQAAVGSAAEGGSLRLKAGVASVAQVPNRFDPARLTSGALSCLNATLVSGSTPVKSIEVY